MSSSSRISSPSREPLLRRKTSMDSLEINQTNDITVNSNGDEAEVGDTKSHRIKKNLDKYEQLFGIDESSSDQPTTTSKELWSYYLYCNGNNGVGPGSYSQALFQSSLSRGGWDPTITPIQKGNCTTGACVIPWGSGTRSVSSAVLIANGICFTIMTIIFVALGSAADYGNFGRWLFLFLTVVCWIFQYGMMSIKEPSQWPAAMALYIVSYISYGATLVFFSALFPRLARYMPHVRKARDEDLKDGKINQAEYDRIESMERNHISNISTAHSNIGYLLTLALSLSVLLPLQGDLFANNLALCLTNSYWLVLGLPWFLFQQPRPGPPIPKGSSYLTIGWKQVYLSLLEIRHLPQTFTYLLAFFMLADGLNTTSTLVSIIQNEVISFSFLQLTYLGLSQAVTSTFSTFAFWYIQQYFGIRTKTMFMITNVFSVLIPLYGMIGLWSDKVGYHHVHDFWIYNIVFGLFQAPYYSYSQTMMSEFTPRGYEGMFFGLFGITNRASSIIGPNVIQAIINSSNNNWMGFPFLFALCAFASIVIWFVDVEKGREDCRVYVEERKLIHQVSDMPPSL
ncbi:autophagy-related protein Atg22B2 [Sclerotinia borealis F-4128]|uniref:Autophagy-related protein n=1 Tax=Sclerotinia borealis (strain F-4128) TaxID=1432307 RepID=W9CK17_SCLBF|nr:autophagy-related protein Atg22B2 [Sclerotinia borealis F-4128]